ncbi:MAG TPA: MBL fold metallo-hydrolase [Thermoanaerobaculia bacterium]|nr:MBL fold metallo-hydrolase [Thermoanaerobaculia bacterium]
MSRGRASLVAAGLSGAAGLAAVAVGCALSVPRWRGPHRSNFDGERFRSIEPLDHGIRDFLRWITNRDRGPWRDFTDTPPGGKPPERAGDGRLRVTFVNHSTVLVQMDGVNLLTDPVWSNRVSPVTWAGPRRHRHPGILFSDLPPIDAVLVSHNHYDHMDVPTLRRLAASRHPRIFVGLGNAAFLSGQGIANARDLDWWESVPLAPGVTLTAVPARHFSSRSPFDRDRALWCGFVVSGPLGSFYFAGDTGWGSHFQMIRDRFPNLNLALLPIGAYRPRWFMSQAHIDPEEAVRAHEVLGAQVSIAIHFGTFAQADDGELEPLDALKAALARRPEPRPRFLALDNGEFLELTSLGNLARGGPPAR